MTKKIIFSTGGTGGHIFPAINLMKHFLEKGHKVLLVTDKRGESFIKNYSEFNSYVLNTGTLTNKNFLKKISSFFIIFFSILRSIIILYKEKPDLIFGFGGYVSFPISFASKFFNLNLVIYENNLVLGRANRYLLPFAKKIFLAKNTIKNFPKNYESKINLIGPILDKNIINNAGLKKNGDKNIFTILVIGGSQGAEIFGTVIPPVIKMIKDNGYSIKINQQCAKGQKKEIENFYEKNNIKNYVFEFEKNILKLLSSTNLAITRCGASTTAELVYTLTPFVAVPLPSSIDDHQFLNAKYYEEKKCCWLLEQKNFNIQNLFNLIIEAIKNESKLKNICENMKKNCSKNVYNDIENEIEKLI
tara:strand:+ start:9765 stop:10844 length:1080 start_codon:yes stop_codon:yes gene_type:complete